MQCTVILYTFRNASYNITVFPLHFTIYSKYTWNSDILSYSILFCITIFFPHGTARQLHRGGRGPIFTPEQEEAICTMVVENNAIRLREIKSAIIEDNNIFENIQTVSISTIDRVLKRHQMNMKQLYTVPFERNCERVKELRYQYVQVKHVWACSNCTSQ